MTARPLIVGLGGTVRAGSSTERALVVALRAAAAAGAETQLFGGAFLARLPIFDPRPGRITPEQAELSAAIGAADGVIVASPGYHGSISGVIKNALDTLELTRDAASPYLSGKPVGAIITADGWQAAGTTLMALRAIIHALRGWPTPFGAALNAGATLFDEAGECREAKDAWQLTTVAEQVMEFATMRRQTLRVRS
ncbi:MAG TPA: NADPH-dependent FMN reductase [Phenylobacterium sp.]|jgi:FMN reductase|nr:NADPH-dependent FMN reductase [Phenylobacterium sp.]